MSKIRNTRCSWLIAGLMLFLPGRMSMAQKRLPISGSEVPPVTGTGTVGASQMPDASSGGSHSSGGPGMGLGLPDDGSDSSVRRNLDALRANMANTERQRVLMHEADQLLQMVAQLQVKIAANATELSPAEMARQVDMIEKLARNVKERMKGAR